MPSSSPTDPKDDQPWSPSRPFILICLFAVAVTAVALVGAALVVAPGPVLAPSIAVFELVVLVGVGLFAVLDARRAWEFVTALTVLTATVLPGLAASFSVAVYVWNPDPEHWHVWLLGVGILIAILVWSFVIYFSRVYAQAQRANPLAYAELLLRLEELEARSHAVPDVASLPPSQAAARENLDAQLATLDRALRSGRAKPEAKWVHSTGYVDLWNRVHRADESLMMLEPDWRLRNSAATDRLMIKDSAMPNEVQLNKQLTRACAMIGTPNDLEGRDLLRRVRRAINEYRDARTDGLVRARNNMLKTTLVTGLLAYPALALALMMGISRFTIASAAALFLVAAVVGLFKRLYDESRTPTIVEDYGLATARLLQAALASGLAGIAGVFLVAMLATLGPSASVLQLNCGGDAGPALLQMYDLSKDPFALLVAATFGLTPSLILRRLHEGPERWAAEFASSESTATKDKTD